MASNKKLGNDFEHEMSQILFNKGFWVHNMAATQAGQPADLIAVKQGQAYLIDCKVCSDNVFPFKRVEENQVRAMNLWQKLGNGTGWFALKLNDGSIWLVSMFDIHFLECQKYTRLNEDDIKTYGICLQEWYRYLGIHDESNS